MDVQLQAIVDAVCSPGGPWPCGGDILTGCVDIYIANPDTHITGRHVFISTAPGGVRVVPPNTDFDRATVYSTPEAAIPAVRIELQRAAKLPRGRPMPA